MVDLVDGLIDGIEANEATLLQHIHTSGLRHQRELQLVDELMVIRTDRRRLTAYIRKENIELNAKITALEEAVATANDPKEFRRKFSSDIVKYEGNHWHLNHCILHYNTLSNYPYIQIQISTISL